MFRRTFLKLFGLAPAAAIKPLPVQKKPYGCENCGGIGKVVRLNTSVFSVAGNDDEFLEDKQSRHFNWSGLTEMACPVCGGLDRLK